MRQLTTRFLILATILSCLPVSTVQAVSPEPNFVPGEVVVGLASGALIKIDLTADQSVSAAVATLEQQPGVAFAEPNFLYRATAFPSDTLADSQRSLTAINAREAWSRALLQREQDHTTRRPIVAVIDTGVFISHPDLTDSIWTNTAERPGDRIDNDQNGFIDDVHGWDFVDRDNNPTPEFTTDYEPSAVQHGTIVSGLASASTLNAQGIAGIGLVSMIMPLRALDSTGSGDVMNVVAAVDYAVANGADVINMSFVGTDYSQALADAVARANARGVIIVAAAGNTDPASDGANLDRTKYYPVCYDGDSGKNQVIGVGAVGPTFKKSPFSNYGGCVDVVAPGEDLFATQVQQVGEPGFDQLYGGGWSGTSVAAPLVSGAAALIRAVRPTLTPAQVLDILFSTARRVDAENPNLVGRLGGGLIDLDKAIALAITKQGPIHPSGGQQYLVAGLGFGSFPQVKVVAADGTELKTFFAYAPQFRGAIEIAVADVNGDGRDDIITAPGAGGGPQVRVLSVDGVPQSQFFALDKKFRGGISVAAGDLNGDGRAEIIVAAGKGAEPIVQIFRDDGKLLKEFLAYDRRFRGGVRVAVARGLNGAAEIVTAPGVGGGPHVRIFTPEGNLASQFFAFNERFFGGLYIATGDVNGDGVDEIVTTPQSGAGPEIRMYTDTGARLATFFAFEPEYTQGVQVTLGDIDADGLDDIVAGRATGKPEIRVFDKIGRQKKNVIVPTGSYQGGVRPGVVAY